MKKVKMILIGLIAGLLVLVCVLFGLLFMKTPGSEKEYRTYMEKGEKYLAELNYEDAIAAFEMAIEKNDKNENAYIRLSEAYIGCLNFDKAKEVLEQGYRKVGSQRLKLLLEQLIHKNSGGDAEQSIKTLASVEEMLENSDVVELDISVLQKLARFQNKDYKREFGSIVSKLRSRDAVEITYQQFGATVTYENIEGEEESIDDASKLPVNEATPTVIQLVDISILFKNFEGAISNERLKKLVGTSIQCVKDSAEDRYVVQFMYKECKFTIESDSQGNIVSKTAWNQIEPKRPEQKSEEVQTVIYQSVVIDAVTGKGLEGATVTFIPKNRDSEAPEVVTAEDGSYEAELTAEETYQIDISKDGYISEKFELPDSGKAGETVVGDAVSVSPELATGEIRIVLTWGATPADLDSHLEGVTATGESVSVDYFQRRQKVGGEIVAELDVDDISGYGPETTTIYAQGTYRFSVYDFSRDGSQAMTDSGAEVKVYLPGQGSPKVFRIPAGEGEWWHVFEIENGQIRSIDERSDRAIE